MSRRVPAVVALLFLASCSRNSPQAPVPGGGTGETISGRERIGWDQAAASTAELGTFRYAIYVDGARSEMADVTCGGPAGPNGFPCSGRLPQMSNGTHVLELASFVDSDGILESAKSAPLRVTVAAAVAGAIAPLANGETIETLDGIRLRADVLVEHLTNPGAVAVARDGRAFVGAASGLTVFREGARPGEPQLAEGPVLSIALSPAFERDAHVYVTQVVRAADGTPAFRTARYRDFAGRLAERMVILENGPPAAEAAAGVQPGPDGKLYIAFDDGGNPDAAWRMSDWSGKVLRMEPDGRTPDDQAAASPVLFSGLTSPRGFDWSADGVLWIADASRSGTERLRVVTATSERPRRAGQRGSFVMPRGIGASALAFYRSDRIPQLNGDLLVASRDAGYILRIRFDAGDRSRPVWTERVLDGRVGAVRALTVAPDGAIYFCTDTSLIRLSSTADRR